MIGRCCASSRLVDAAADIHEAGGVDTLPHIHS